MTVQSNELKITKDYEFENDLPNCCYFENKRMPIKNIHKTITKENKRLIPELK
jgi:hypothetical protein